MSNLRDLRNKKPEEKRPEEKPVLRDVATIKQQIESRAAATLAAFMAPGTVENFVKDYWKQTAGKIVAAVCGLKDEGFGRIELRGYRVEDWSPIVQQVRAAVDAKIEPIVKELSSTPVEQLLPAGWRDAVRKDFEEYFSRALERRIADAAEKLADIEAARLVAAAGGVEYSTPMAVVEERNRWR